MRTRTIIITTGLLCSEALQEAEDKDLLCSNDNYSHKEWSIYIQRVIAKQLQDTIQKDTI